MHYKAAQASTRELGEEGVHYVLDGSYQSQRSTSGPREVTLNLELIRVADDTQVWTYIDTKGEADIFTVQSQIASEVIARLGIPLVDPARAAAAPPTEDSVANDLFLKGNDYLYRAREVTSPSDFRIAIDFFADAVARDPAFAEAHAQLSVAHHWLWEIYGDHTDDRLHLARDAADEATIQDAELPAAHYAHGLIHVARGAARPCRGRVLEPAGEPAKQRRGSRGTVQGAARARGLRGIVCQHDPGGRPESAPRVARVSGGWTDGHDSRAR
jgi:hypothetical protein